MKGGTKYAESIKNFEKEIEHTDLVTKEEKEMKVEKRKNKKRIFKMIATVVVIIADLFQKELDRENERNSNGDIDGF